MIWSAERLLPVGKYGEVGCPAIKYSRFQPGELVSENMKTRLHEKGDSGLSLTTACRCCMPSPAPIFLCQYNPIIASLWQYNCSHCELGENLKLYSCLESMRAPDNMYYSLRGCSTISYCSLSVIFYKIGVQIL